MRRALCLSLALGLSAALPPILEAQAAATDPEIVKGVRQVDEGDYDAAIVTLDTAARRLAANPAKVRDLSQAYLYLGIAYVGKGHEAAAKAKFREAMAGITDLTLSADKYPPKVINLFEAARDEAAKARAAAPAAAPGSRPAVASSPTSGGGGGKKWLVIGGVGAVAAGGGAYALTRGESSCDTAYIEERGIFNASQILAQFNTEAADAGHWRAKVTWTVVSSSGASAHSGARPVAPPVGVKIEVFDSGGSNVATSFLRSDTESEAEWDAPAGATFRVKIGLEGTGGLSWELIVDGPCL